MTDKQIRQFIKADRETKKTDKQRGQISKKDSLSKLTEKKKTDKQRGQISKDGR